jgi:isoleucyl-tRNA synthetase
MDLREQILEELNIKEIEYIEDDSALATYIVKPNFATLSVKYGKQLGEIRAFLAKLPSTEVAGKIQKGGSVELQLTDNKVFLSAEDLLIERQDAEGYAVVFEGGYTVAIDTRLTEELKKEGYVRDLVRHVQTLRKEADFQVDDRIIVNTETTTTINNALNDHLDYFKRETLAVKVGFTYKSGEIEKELIIDGNKIRVSVSRID